MAPKLGRRRLSLRSAQLGQAMLEFLIVAPVFILIIFGAMQTALIFSAKTSLNYAVFQAARVGAVNNATSLRNLVVFMESTYLEGERKKQFSLHEASSSKFHYSLKH